MGEVWPMRGPARRVVAFVLTAFMTLGTVPAQALEEIASATGDEQSQEVAENDSLELAGDENASDVSAMLGDDGVEELTPIEGDVEQSSDDAMDDGLAGEDDSLEMVEEDATTDESEAADDSEALVVEDAGQEPEAEDEAAVEAAEDSGKATVVAEDGTPSSTNGIVAQADATAAAVPITKAKAAKIADQAYTGRAVRPAVSLTYGGARLRAGTDYTVSYRNNTEAGTATATVTGAGGFSGTRSLRFRIVRPSVSYGVHRQTYGDQEDVRDGAVAGTTGESKRLEAIWIGLGGGFPVAGGIAYRAHVQGIGWQGWRSDGEAAGTRGESRRLEAVQIRLTGRMAKGYDVWYRVHAQNVGWMGWAKNGRAAGTSGLSWRLEAIQVVVLPRGSAAPGDVAGVSPATPERYVKRPAAVYRALPAGGRWSRWGESGATRGAPRGSAICAVRAKLGSASSPSGSLRCRVRARGGSWSAWARDGATAGDAAGEAADAVQLKLKGNAAKYLDVWYRVRVGDLGWLGWARNGKSAGTGGDSKPVEAIQVKIVPKGGAAPGSTSTPYKTVSDFTSGDAELDSIVKTIIATKTGTGSDALRKAFDYVVSFPYIDGEAGITGDWRVWSIAKAKQMYNRPGGNCYHYGSLMAWIARGLGYNARAVSGEVKSGVLSWSYHGWCEITKDGNTYVLDPDLQKYIPDRNFFMVTYDDAPTYYTAY